MFDHRAVKLGKKPAKIDKRTLRIAKYAKSLPPPPASCDWFGSVTSWGMMENDSLGDCTCAAVGHGVQVATLNSPDGEVTPPDSTILQLYEQACGYIPGDPNTDNGGVIIDVLNFVRQNRPWTHKQRHKHTYELYAYADPSTTNIVEVKQAIATLGIVDIGIQLPITAQAQVGSLWDVVGNPQTDQNSQPGSWGGHSVVCCAYDANTITCITWGALQPMAWNFFTTYVDECHALLFRAWVEQFAAQNPTALQELEADLAAVTG
jgi:hypothetical protein